MFVVKKRTAITVLFFVKENNNMDIFEELAKIYLDVNSYKWSPFLNQSKSNFDIKSKETQDAISNLMHKLEYLINNPANTIISWVHFRDRLHKSFQEWLLFELNNVSVP